MTAAVGCHDGVACGRSGQKPIEGVRYTKNQFAEKKEFGMDVNDEGAVVKLGNDQYKDIGHDGSHKYYCGRRMPIPGTDGQCGPSGGPQCKSCLRFQEKKDLGDQKKQRSSSFDDGGGDGDALPADLCAAEWEKLTPEEQSNYRAVEPPTRTLAVPASGVRLTWTSPAPPATAETAAEAAKGISVLSDSAFASLPEGAKKPESPRRISDGRGQRAKGEETRGKAKQPDAPKKEEGSTSSSAAAASPSLQQPPPIRLTARLVAPAAVAPAHQLALLATQVLARASVTALGALADGGDGSGTVGAALLGEFAAAASSRAPRCARPPPRAASAPRRRRAVGSSRRSLKEVRRQHSSPRRFS